jgi:glycosyltransferase involved in cell wall biosynthesis
MRRWPLTSIIMPTYNAAGTVELSIQSVLGQSVSDLELIVVNDGSTDRTEDVVKRQKDSRLTLISTSNMGVSHARNVGLSVAAGEYIQYLDSDDLLHERKIELQLRRLLSSQPLCAAVCAWGRFVDTLDDAQFVCAPDWADLDPYDHLRLNLGGGGTMPVFTWLVPRVLATRAGRWNEELSLREDTEYFTRIAMSAERILFCEDSRGYYRSGSETSLSALHGKQPARSILAASRLIEDAFLGKYHTRKDSRRIIANLYRRGSIALFQIHPRLAWKSEEAVNRLGGSELIPGPGGRGRRILARLFGWRLCLQLMYVRWVILRFFSA